MTMEKPNGTVIKVIKRTLQDAFVGGKHTDLILSAIIIRQKHRFLFWTWNDYEIERSIPYIHSQYYDGEFNTNRRLGVLAEEMEQEAKMAILQDGEAESDNNGRTKK